MVRSKHGVFWGIGLVALAGLVGCSPEPPPSPTAGGTSNSASRGPKRRPQAADAQPIDPTTVGSIRGTVLFEGEAPERKPLSISGAAGCHVEGHTPLTERVIVNDGRLVNVFVHVDRGLESWQLPDAPETAVLLDQKGCTYVPHVAGIQVGQTLRILNSDGATHNVHARPRRNDSFNRSQPPGGAPLEHVFERREVMLPIVCDIHPWMKTWIGVVEHPFHAVSAEDGTFVIEGLPPGTYTLAVWHEAYDEREIEVTVASGEATSVELSFP